MKNTLTLSLNEKQIIDNILNEAELEYFNDNNNDETIISKLDEKSRNIWNDWDFSINNSIKKNSNIEEKIEIKEKENLIEQKNNNLKNEISPSKKSYIPFSQTILQEKENLSDSSNSPFHISDDSDLNLLKKSDLKLKNNFKKNFKEEKKIKPKKNIELYNRSDGAKLRQENIELKSHITKLQLALDRSYLENDKLKEENEKLKNQIIKQNSIIKVFKHEKLYGKK